MKQGTRKRKVGIVTPPDVRYIASTPSPNTKRAKPTYSSPSDFRTWDEDDVCDFLEEKGHEDVAATLKGLCACRIKKMGIHNSVHSLRNCVCVKGTRMHAYIDI